MFHVEHQNMIRHITTSDSEQLKKILRECFTQDEDYLTLFVEKCPVKDGLCYEKEGQIVSVLFTFPIEYISEKTTPEGYHISYKGLYVYGVCTSPEWRRNNFSTELMEFLKSEATALKLDFLLLRPSESDPKLMRHYMKAGFKIPVWKRDNQPAFDIPANIINESPHLLFLKRLKFYGGNFFQWSPSILSYIIKEAQLNTSQMEEYSKSVYLLASPLCDSFILDNDTPAFAYPME